MDPLRTYRAFRELSKQIHSDALKDVPKWALSRGAERLRMVGERGVLIFETEDELDVLMQFVLYELLQDGRPIIWHHLEKRGPARNAMEEELFHGIRNSFSSLFWIQRVRPDGIVLKNLLTPDQELHTLVDIGLIQTGAARFLLFTRLLPLREYAITAGVSFPFEGSHQEALIAEAHKLRPTR